MPRVNIWVEAMKLVKIDAYCKEKGISRSRLFVRGAMAQAHSQPIPRCGFCSNVSLGRYRITMTDWETGERQEDKYLCVYHLKKAQAEGEVKEL